MRGNDGKQSELFSYVSLESRVPQDHPLRPIRAMVEEALRGLDRDFEDMYSRTGRPSIAPERLLKALHLQLPYRVRNERMPNEQHDHNLLFVCLVRQGVD